MKCRPVRIDADKPLPGAQRYREANELEIEVIVVDDEFLTIAMSRYSLCLVIQQFNIRAMQHSQRSDELILI